MSEIDKREIRRCFELISKFNPRSDVTIHDLEQVKESLIKRMNKQQTKRQNIWRIIMKSKEIKLTTAAAIIIVVTAGIYHYTGSFHGTSAAFATSDVIAAMKQVQWIHVTHQMVDTNNVPAAKLDYWNGREYWQSIDPYRTIEIGLGGDIEFVESNLKKVYDPKNNTITVIFGLYPKQTTPVSMQEIWLDVVSDLEKRGAKVEYSDSVYEDRPAKIIKVDYTKESGWREEITIIADTETRLARKIMVYQKTPECVSGTILMLLNYPSTGPKDIYEAGVPRDAVVKVIDNFEEEK